MNTRLISRALTASMLLVAAGCSCSGGTRADSGLFDSDGGDAAAESGMVDAADASDDSMVPMDGGGDDAAVPDGSTDGGVEPRACADTESCYDGLDDDCDGVVDEDCPCVPGETQACFRGDPRGRGVGICRDGTMVCTGSAEFGTWGPCEGDTVEAAETCDEGGVDENCDGASNEGCECVDGDPPLPCGTDEGICEMGTQACVDGRRTDCEGATSPMVETCDGVDEDCDGLIDEDIRRPCGSDVGACRPGFEACSAGVFGACEGGNASAPESCDDLDNDCDGMTDESVSRTCGTDVGRCIAGTELCTGGVFSACEGREDPIAESCNGVDDDCDGLVDETLTRTCGSTDLGVCMLGVETCGAGGWGACLGATLPGTEVCDGADDENCDGSIDEGCACVSGATRPCGTDVGACVAGTETCDASGAWGACDGRVGEVAESCNGVDDDCDGSTDEGVSRSCGVTDLGICSFGTQTCAAGSFGACVGATLPGTEACDGATDENCDGSVDEGCSCVTGGARSCGSDVGRCVAGTETCDASGAWGACSGEVGPVGETCDGVDENCDGSIDEMLNRSCGTDVGVCVAGVQTCSVGAWGGCVGEVASSTELCDGTDDEDCDGAVDEGCGCTAGTMRSCGSAVGRCLTGTQTCDVMGSWGACVGEVGPIAEACDGVVDENCDGTVDEGCDCVTGSNRDCGTNVGACTFGTEACDALGRWGVCVGGFSGGTESCNGVDDDCDSRVDETLSRSCGTDVGACATGTETCSAGAWGSCLGGTTSTTELCDGSVDEDCDGSVDEACLCTNGDSRSCGNDTGACVAGTETCNISGAWGSCLGQVGSSAEVCNNIDDDCDGSTDETLTRTCGSDTGVCETGTETCSTGAWGSCVGEVVPGIEACDGSLDEDCDGTVDDGCLCTDGQTRSCGTNMGVCTSGTETCDVTGTWGSCLGATSGGSESCNSMDDDCDGSTDEGGVCVPPTVSCPMGGTTDVGTVIALSGGGSDPDGGSVGFAWTVVSAPVGSSATPSPAGAASTSFIPDVAGDYTLRLCVTDNEGESSCCTVPVTAMSSCSPPTPPTLSSCGTSWDRRPVVEFGALPSGVTYELFAGADVTPYGTVSTVGQNYFRPSSDLGAGSMAGTDVDIYARACLTSDTSCCANSLAVTVSLVEDCSSSIAPSASNLIISEYVTNGDGSCAPGSTDCEAGEAFEVVNLTNCPISLDNHHFSYCNGSCTTFRWMDFTAVDVVPPRGVYVAIRNLAGSSCDYPFFGPNDPGLFGLRVSALSMMASGSLASGWFVNGGGGSTALRIATGPFVDMTTGTTIDIITPYSGSAGECSSIGFDAFDACGNVSAVSTPTDVLTPNQLGRLWHPCDAIVTPVPDTCM